MASFFAFITKITGMASHGRTCSVRNPYGRIGKSYELGQPFLLCLLPQDIRKNVTWKLRHDKLIAFT